MSEADISSVDRQKEEGMPSPYRPLRVWPALLLLVGMLCVFVPHSFNPDQLSFQMIRMLGPALLGISVMIWWLSFSRARWTERLLGLIGTAIAFFIVVSLLDSSMVGVPMIMVTIPMGMAAFGLATILCRNRLAISRTYIVLVFALLGFGFSILLRGSGVFGDGSLILGWRFKESTEQRLAAERGDSTSSKNENALSALLTETIDQWLADPEWSAFRGDDRRGVVADCVANTVWTQPPTRKWSRDVGLGWSSFSVAGEMLFTQEQRGELETVVCYSTETGEELWTQGIKSRFEDSIGGPGPRATPTIAHGDLFVMGASGQLMRLDARSGDIKWQTDIRDVAKRDPPTWGYSASPLVTESSVIVWAGGADDLGTLAFDIEDGKLVWSVASGNHTYSSPQICHINGANYVTMLSNNGVELINPETGELALGFESKVMGYRTLQPRMLDGNRMLVPGETGVKCIEFDGSGGSLTAKELWTSPMRSDFNDLVVFGDHAYGFDGTIFCCIRLDDGSRAWKGGRYGKGQVLLLENKETLLVLTEYGEIVLVKADPASHKELERIDGIQGKTWNHPVLIGERLYIRNSLQAACFELPKQAD